MGRTLLTAVIITLASASCTPADEPAARAAGESFQAALRQHHDADACGLLSVEARNNLESGSGKPCVQAIAGLKLPTGAVRTLQVWGGNSQLQLDTGVLFMAQFDTGWKVTGAGCQPRPDMPYDCVVEG